MYKSILSVALLGSCALAAPPAEKRQATDGAQYTSAGNDLISAYVPTAVYSGLVSVASEAAARASITGDAASLLNSAFLDHGLPDWLKTAIPSAWSSQISALESGLDSLRGTVGLAPFVVAVTTTDSKGATVTNQVTTYVPPTATDIVSLATTQVVDGVTSVFTTAFNGASSIASVIQGGGSSVASQISAGGSSVVSQISSGGSSVVSQISSGGSSVVGQITSGASSVFSDATRGASSILSQATNGASSVLSRASTAANGPSTTTSAGGAAAMTAAAGGVLGVIGLMIAL